MAQNRLGPVDSADCLYKLPGDWAVTAFRKAIWGRDSYVEEIIHKHYFDCNQWSTSFLIVRTPTQIQPPHNLNLTQLSLV